MQSTIDLKDEIFKKLQNKSQETGVDPDTIINEILNESLDNYPMVKLADDFKELIDICDYPEQTDAVELKQLSWEK